MDGQESFDGEKDASAGSHDSSEGIEDDSDDSGSPPRLYRGQTGRVFRMAR